MPAALQMRSRVWPWLIMAATLVCVGAAQGYIIFREHEQITANERDRLLSQARVIGKNLDRQIAAVHAALREVREEIPDWRIQGSAEANRHLSALCLAMPGVRTMLIAGPTGRVLAANRPELMGGDVSHRDFFIAPREAPDPARFYVSPPFQSSLGVFVLNLSILVPGPDNAFGGVITAALNPEYFSTLMTSVLTTPDMWSAIAHGGGRQFIMLPARENMSGMNLAKPGSFFSRHQDSGLTENVLTGVVLATGESRMMALVTLSPPGLGMDYPLVVAVSRDLDAIYASLRQETASDAAILGGIAIAACLALFFSQRRQARFERFEAQARRALMESERFLAAVADNIPGMVGHWDKNLVCTYANRAYQEWFGKSPEQMRGIHALELLGGQLYEGRRAHIEAALGGLEQHFEQRLTKPDGSVRHVMVNYIPDLGPDGVNGVFAITFDVTELKETQIKLEQLVAELNVLAATDPLTGVSNRRHFRELAQREIDRGKRFGEPVVLLMIDIDHFKAINDTHGHDCGDAVLKSLATTCGNMLRSVDLFCRYGGEEFAILLANTGLDGGFRFAERLRQALSATAVACHDSQVRFTVSIGVALLAGPGQDLDALIRASDQALYKAKQTGRDRTCLATDPC